jgi:hypothetical protein
MNKLKRDLERVVNKGIRSENAKVKAGRLAAAGKSLRIIRVTLENHEVYTSNSLQINPGEEINLNIQLQPGS